MSSRLKLLLFGSIGDQVEAFCTKLKALHESKAGPFDVAFCVGSASLEQLLQKDFPLPVYLHGIVDESSLQNIESTPTENEDSLSCCLRLKTNLFLLRDPNNGKHSTANIWSVQVAPGKPEIVVAVCPPYIRVDSRDAKPLLDKVTHVSYRGCDLLFSYELPQGSERFMDATNLSFDVADIALKARARYHVVPANTFQQSPPFAHLEAATSTASTDHVGRILSLAPVIPAAAVKAAGKGGKYVHALGMTPLLHMDSVELASQRPAIVAPCPFTDDSYKADTKSKYSITSTAGLSEASARRIMAEERQKQSGASAPAQRWAQKRSRQDDDGEVDPTSTTLFVHGLHKDVTGRLQVSPVGDDLVLRAFSKWGAVKVRKPPGAATSTFCFVEFPSHEKARVCLDDLSGEITVENVQLTVKWGSHEKKRKAESGKPARLTEAEAMDSTTVYFKISSHDSIDALDLGNVSELIRKWMETTLEDALADGSDTVTTAEEEPALRVQVRVPDSDKSYGFLDFASHAAASMALATLTGNTDGGQVLEDAPKKPDAVKHSVLYLNWAHARVDHDTQIIEDESGFKFERKHFPADSRQDCWFCLASDACEKHLITGVFSTCYSAMPKGPVHPGHMLLIPVTHSSRGALKDPAVSQEMEVLKAKLRQHAAREYDADLFVFERAIQTKGGYHTHIQCIPVERKLGGRLQATMLAQAKRLGMQLRELNSDIGLSSVMGNEDDEDEGYFYAEIPLFGSEIKRFLYKADGSNRVPLQFGREVLAAVLGKPELAHWKSCVLDTKEEAALAAKFRDSFAKLVKE